MIPSQMALFENSVNHYYKAQAIQPTNSVVYSCYVKQRQVYLNSFRHMNFVFR